MNLGQAIGRIGADAKAFVIRFATRSGSWWGGDGSLGYMARRRDRLAWAVGDGSGNSIVVAAVGWIRRNFPEAPPRIQERDPDGELGSPTDPGAIRLQELLLRPNPSYGRALLDMAKVADYWITGNAYELKMRDSSDLRVLSRWWAPSWSIRPHRELDSPNFVDWYVYRPTPTSEYHLRPEDVIHHRYGFDPDNPMEGFSPIASVLREIYTDEEASTYTATILRNLGVPGVIIIPDEDVEVEPDDAEGIKQQFSNEFTAEGRGRPMVLSARSKVERISFSPQELNLRDLRKIPEERTTAALGLPAIVAGMGAGLDRSTFANYHEAREAAYEENIIPTQRLWGDDFTIQLLPDFVADVTRFAIDYDLSEVRVLQEDENARWERYVGGFSKGAITLRAMYQGLGIPVDEQDPPRDAYFLRDARLTAVPEYDPEATGIPDPNAPEPPVDPNALPGLPPGTVPLSLPPTVPANGNGNATVPVP